MLGDGVAQQSYLCPAEEMYQVAGINTFTSRVKCKVFGNDPVAADFSKALEHIGLWVCGSPE